MTKLVYLKSKPFRPCMKRLLLLELVRKRKEGFFFIYFTKVFAFVLTNKESKQDGHFRREILLTAEIRRPTVATVTRLTTLAKVRDVFLMLPLILEYCVDFVFV